MPDRYLIKWDSAQGHNQSKDLRDFDMYAEQHKPCAIFANKGPVYLEEEEPPVPWITLVLGSECLEIGAEPLSWPHFAGALKESLVAAGISSASTQGVSTFARHIIEDRYPGKVVEPGPNDPIPSHPYRQLARWEALLLDATFKMSGAYYQAMAEWNGAMSRWGETSIPLLGVSGDGVAYSTDRRRKVDELIGALKELAEALAQEEVPKVGNLITRIRREVSAQEPQLNLLDLKAATEICWQVLIQGEAVSQGWPELLIALSLTRQARPIPEKRPRPGRAGFMSPDNVRDGIRAVLSKLSEDSREESGDSRSSARESAYREYARLLRAQAVFRSQQSLGRYEDIVLDPSLAGAHWEAPVNPTFGCPGTSTEGVPPGNPATDPLGGASTQRIDVESNDQGPLEAAAFVTTFDIELEMAMAREFPGEPFVVAVPVEVTAKVDLVSRAKGIWMGYVVNPPKASPDPSPESHTEAIKHAIVHPSPDAWVVLSGADLNREFDVSDPLRAMLPGRDTLAGLPFIVRVMGSPLIDLTIDRNKPILQTILKHTLVPDETSPGEAKRSGDQPRPHQMPATQLKHAVILEENQSLRWSVPAAALGIRSLPRGLPRALTSSTPGFWRYWAFVGVQFSDSVVRQRLISEMVAAGILQQNSSSYRRPMAMGLAVNREPIGSRATETLLWSEIDVVQDDCAKLNGYFSHYTAHLTAASSGLGGIPGEPAYLKWPRNDQECNVK